MSINRVTSTFDSIQGVVSQSPIKAPAVDQGRTERTNGKSFADVLSNSLKEINALDQDANTQVEGLITGKGGVTTHSAMIALEKADTAFQLMNTIRTKIIRVYEEVLRTQI
jgi:flagellar hook-basal body complex protein FliE